MSFFSILLENCFRQKSENYNYGSSAAAAAFQSYSMIADYEAHLYLQIVIVRSVISPQLLHRKREKKGRFPKNQKIRMDLPVRPLGCTKVVNVHCYSDRPLRYTKRYYQRPFSATFQTFRYIFFREIFFSQLSRFQVQPQKMHKIPK